MGMKMNNLDVGHIIRNGCYSLHGLSCEVIYDDPVRLERYIAIPFDELLNDFIVHINHFVDDIPDQRVHRGHPNDGECRGHHYLKVNLLKRG
jgi:hypothetical protein